MQPRRKKDAEGLIATAVVYGANELYNQIDEMDFGNAIKALKFGKAIRRKGWNGKGLFVVKQVPAHIGSDIIPKMQSLPQSAKDLILAGKGFVDYTSQCLIYNENNGRADSWSAVYFRCIRRRLGGCRDCKIGFLQNLLLFYGK